VFTALEIRDEADIIRGLHRGELEARILVGERAQASAPPDVSGTLRLTARAEADALQQSADAEVRHDESGAASAKSLAGQLAAERQRLDVGNARYEQWAADTRGTRETAGKARAELQRRGQAQPPQRAPEPDPGPTEKASPEDRPLSARHAQDDWAARLDELLARADHAAQRLMARQAERQASSEYAARIERQARTEHQAGHQAEAREGIEIEM
jgi:hypothetical protein